MSRGHKPRRKSPHPAWCRSPICSRQHRDADHAGCFSQYQYEITWGAMAPPVANDARALNHAISRSSEANWLRAILFRGSLVRIGDKRLNADTKRHPSSRRRAEAALPRPTTQRSVSLSPDQTERPTTQSTTSVTNKSVANVSSSAIMTSLQGVPPRSSVRHLSRLPAVRSCHTAPVFW